MRRKAIVLSVFLTAAVFLAVGCASTTSTTKAMNDASAQSYSEMGVGMTSTINESIGTWAETGSISSGVEGLGASGVKAQSITGPDSNGYFHIVESTTEGALGLTGTFEADLYVKLVSAEGKVTDVYVYGSYSYAISSSTGSLSYSLSFGSSPSTAYHATATWSGTDLTRIGASGSIAFTISGSSASEGSHSIAMTLSYSSDFSVPVTSVSDYPSGTVTIASTYDGASNPNIVITFTGTSTATITYGDYSSTFTITST